MIKILSIVLALVLCLSFGACGKEKPEGSAQTEKIEATEPTEEVIEEYVVYTSEGAPTGILTIEEVILKPYSGNSVKGANFCMFRMKVRNTSDEDISGDSNLQIFYNYLDENMDVLSSDFIHPIRHNTLDVDRAEKIEMNKFPSNWTKAEFDEVTFIEIYGYQVGSLHMEPSFELEEPILINIRDFIPQ